MINRYKRGGPSLQPFGGLNLLEGFRENDFLIIITSWYRMLTDICTFSAMSKKKKKQKKSPESFAAASASQTVFLTHNAYLRNHLQMHRTQKGPDTSQRSLFCSKCESKRLIESRKLLTLSSPEAIP